MFSWFKKHFIPRESNNHRPHILRDLSIRNRSAFIFIKIKNHHKDLIVNGLIVLVIIGSIFTVNYYLSYHNAAIAENIDYSNENK